MILCLGTTPAWQRTLTFDRLEIDEVNRAADVREYASGKAVNVARVLKTLGHDPLVIGFAGGDRGRALREDLDREGIRHDFLTVSAPTRVCTTVIDRATGAVTELVEESLAVEPSGWDQLGRKLAERFQQADVSTFSGSLPPGGPPDLYARALHLAKPRGTPVIIDASGEPMRLALQDRAFPFQAKLNRSELGRTLGVPVETDEQLLAAMRQVTSAGISLLVTLGAAGAIGGDGGDGGGFWRITAPKIQALNPIGSGDAFTAGMAAVAAKKGTPREAWATGAACGTANAMTPLAGQVRPGDVDELLRSVRVELIQTPA